MHYQLWGGAFRQSLLLTKSGCQPFSTSKWCWRAQLLAGPAACETGKFSCSEKIIEKFEKKEIQNQSDLTKFKRKDGGMAQDAVGSTHRSASFAVAHQDAMNDTTQRILFRANLVLMLRPMDSTALTFLLRAIAVSLFPLLGSRPLSSRSMLWTMLAVLAFWHTGCLIVGPLGWH